MTRHLTDELSDYADRRMSGPALLAWDRHVSVCEHCRYAVTAERRMLSSLRSGPPSVSPHLQAMLLSLADSAPTVAGPSPAPGHRAPWACADGASPAASPHFPPSQRAPWALANAGDAVPDRGAVPPIPIALAPVAPFRLPTVAPAAPALHRSLRRAAALAGLAASATVAAAWAVGVAGPVQQPTLNPAARLTYPTFGADTTGLAVPAIAPLTPGTHREHLTIPAGLDSAIPDTPERSDR